MVGATLAVAAVIEPARSDLPNSTIAVMQTWARNAASCVHLSLRNAAHPASVYSVAACGRAACLGPNNNAASSSAPSLHFAPSRSWPPRSSRVMDSSVPVTRRCARDPTFAFSGALFERTPFDVLRRGPQPIDHSPIRGSSSPSSDRFATPDRPRGFGQLSYAAQSRQLRQSAGQHLSARSPHGDAESVDEPPKSVVFSADLRQHLGGGLLPHRSSLGAAAR